MYFNYRAGETLVIIIKSTVRSLVTTSVMPTNLHPDPGSGNPTQNDGKARDFLCNILQMGVLQSHTVQTPLKYGNFFNTDTSLIQTGSLIFYLFILFYNLCHLTGLTHRASCSFTGNLLMQY